MNQGIFNDASRGRYPRREFVNRNRRPELLARFEKQYFIVPHYLSRQLLYIQRIERKTCCTLLVLRCSYPVSSRAIHTRNTKKLLSSAMPFLPFHDKGLSIGFEADERSERGIVEMRSMFGFASFDGEGRYRRAARKEIRGKKEEEAGY